jgi:hypothetical protein
VAPHESCPACDKHASHRALSLIPSIGIVPVRALGAFAIALALARRRPAARRNNGYLGAKREKSSSRRAERQAESYADGVPVSGKTTSRAQSRRV